jgi:hypothetical protein
MDRHRYRLNLDNGAHGPGDIAEIVISDGGDVRGPNSPNWQSEYMLGICEVPTSYRGDELRFVTLAPRYVGDSLAQIRQSGGTVGVGRVLPGRDPGTSRAFGVDDIEYWAIGVLSHLKS